jgi:hypothetical protein
MRHWAKERRFLRDGRHGEDKRKEKVEYRAFSAEVDEMEWELCFVVE